MSNDSTTAAIPYISQIDTLYGTLCICSFLIGTAGNALALIYFLRKKQDVPTLIYTSVVIVDMLVAVVVFPVAVSLYDNRKRVFFSSKAFCDVWGLAWVSVSRMSVFLVALLSVSRAYSLTFPFHVVRRRTILAVILTAALLHILGSTIPLWFRDQHKYHRAMASCIEFTSNYMPDGALDATLALDWVGILLPMPVITVSFLITVFQLAKKSMAGGGSGDVCKNNITFTIALFTALYLFFNLPAVVITWLYSYTSLLPWPDTHYLVSYVFVLNIPLNSACNPLLYFWRMERLRSHSTALVMCRSKEYQQTNRTLRTYIAPAL